jgi:hypothetical protein
MCFPSKKQKALYSDEATKQAPPEDTKAPTPAAPASTTTPINNSSQMAPNVAIVIYSMYGHVAKRSCRISSPLYFYLIHYLLQWLRLRRKVSSLLVVRPPSTSMRGFFPVVTGL